jgi:hypothetical protein
MKAVNFILILFTIILLGSCTERIDIDLDSSYTRLVVEGSISTDTLAHKVRLSKSSDYFSNTPAEGISGATVWFTADNNDSIPLIESDSLSGSYFTANNIYGIPGKSYQLHIILPQAINNQTSYTSSVEKIPFMNPIDSISLQYQPDWGDKGYWEIKVWAWDPETIDYYMFKAHLNHVLVTDTLYEVFITDDIFFNGRYTNGITSQYYDLSKDDEQVKVGDTATFELNSITREYFDFFREVQEEIFGHNPMFSGPPANVRGNITGGAMGYFSAYSISRCSRIITEKDLIPE